MNDDRSPKPDPIGHATIPPELRPFLGATAQAEEQRHRTDPTMDAAFAQIHDALGEDVQEIDPDLGVGNASAYVGPALVPDAAKGKAFTAKVKIVERQAKSDPLPAPTNDGERAAGESPWASDATAVVPAAVLPSSHAPRAAVPVAEGAAPGSGGSRGRAITVAIAALGIMVFVGVWIVARGSRVVVTAPTPAMSGTATAAPSVQSSAAMVPAPSGTSEVDAGASWAPRAPTTAAAYKPKHVVVKGEDPYDAAPPLRAKTAEPVVPPPSLSVIPSPPPPIGGDRVFGN
jgi:hypothetical protein